ISSPITIVIDVDFGPRRFGSPYPAGVIGSTSGQDLSGGDGFYEDFRQSLLQSAGSSEETALYNALPSGTVPTNIGPARDVEVSSPILRALGLIDPIADPTREMTNFGPPPAIGFNSAIPFDFTPDNGIDRNTFDFDSTVVHEVAHALGFTSNAGFRDLVPSFPAFPTVWDLYRFSDSITSQTFSTSQRILTAGTNQSELQVFFANGGSKVLLSTGGPAASRGDRNQSSHWRIKELTPNNTKIGVMDPVGRPGDRDVITQADIDALNVFGYQVGAAQANVTVKVTSPNGSENIGAGGSLPIAWTVNSTNAVSTQSIDLSTDGGASFPIPVALGIAGTARSFNFNVPSSLLTNNARIRVTARDANGTAGDDSSDADFIIATPRADFSLAVTPNSQTVGVGTSTSFNVNVQGLNNFSQQVTLSATTSPQSSDVTTSFSNASVSPGTPSTLTVTTSSTTQAGTINLTITGRSGDITRTVAATVSVVSSPTFMFNVTPATQSVLAGSSGVFSASLQALAGFNQPATLTATSDQSKISNITFSQSTITPGQNSNITIATPVDSPAVTANITITATSGQIVRTATVKLEVLA
ncbi:MAG: peptidase S8/S53 subtilisin kexin sedolisin, partial [bacterium]